MRRLAAVVRAARARRPRARRGPPDLALRPRRAPARRVGPDPREGVPARPGAARLAADRLGVLAWSLGEVYYTVVLWDAEVIAIPSPADIGYLLLPPLVLAGIVLLLRARAREVPRTLWVDGVIAALAVGALSAALVFETVLANVEGNAAAVATNLAYPLGDLVLLGLIVGALAGTGWRLDRTWMLLAIGVSTFWLADSLYLVKTVEGTFVSGGPIDTGWWAGLLLIAGRRLAAPAHARARPAGGQPAPDRRPAVVRAGRARAARLRLRRGPQPARDRPRRRLAARGHGPPDAHLPRERRDAARLARGGDDRRADRPRQPPRAGGRDRRAGSRGRRARSSARARAVRPRRLQALQRHLRPPGRRRAARAPRHQPLRLPAGARQGVPDGRRRVLRADRARRRRSRPARALRRRRRCRSSGEGFTIGCSYGSILLPGGGDRPGRGAADRRPAHVRRRSTPAGCRPGARARTCC